MRSKYLDEGIEEEAETLIPRPNGLGQEFDPDMDRVEELPGVDDPRGLLLPLLHLLRRPGRHGVPEVNRQLTDEREGDRVGEGRVKEIHLNQTTPHEINRRPRVHGRELAVRHVAQVHLL